MPKLIRKRGPPGGRERLALLIAVLSKAFRRKARRKGEKGRRPKATFRHSQPLVFCWKDNSWRLQPSWRVTDRRNDIAFIRKPGDSALVQYSVVDAIKISQAEALFVGSAGEVPREPRAEPTSTAKPADISFVGGRIRVRRSNLPPIYPEEN